MHGQEQWIADSGCCCFLGGSLSPVVELDTASQFWHKHTLPAAAGQHQSLATLLSGPKVEKGLIPGISVARAHTGVHA